MVDSVPEFVKRQWGRPQRRRSSSATTTEPAVGAAKCVPGVHAGLDGAGDDGIRVADAHDPEAVVEVEVLVAVDVPHPRAPAAVHVDGPRVGLLELGRHARRA
jgi:hypothetical protein